MQTRVPFPPVHFLSDTMYEFYMEAYRSGEAAKELGAHVALVLPLKAMEAPRHAKLAVATVMVYGYEAGFDGQDPLTFAQFDMHILDYLDY